MAGPLGVAAIEAGGSFLENIADRIFGAGDRKRRDRFIEFLKARLGQGGISSKRQGDIFRDIDRSLEPGRQATLERINQRLGLDSGAAQAEFLRISEPIRARSRADIALLSERLRSQEDQNLLGGITEATLRRF